MAWTRWQGVLGGSAATLLLTASATIALAQTATLTPPTTLLLPYIPPPIVSTPAKPAATKTVAKRPAPAHPAKRIAAARPKAPATKLAAAPKKPPPAKNIAVAAKKPAAPTKIAAATLKLMPASYTVTTTRDNVTYTSTRVIPVTSATTVAPPPTVTPSASLTKPVTTTPLPPPATTVTVTPTPPRTATLAAIPASLTSAAETAPRVEKAVAPAKPAAPPATTTAPPPSPGSAPAFVSNFLKAAFRIAKSDGKTSLQRRAELADLFASKMDMKFIAGYTTADELTGATADMQQRFRAVLVNYLVETYYPRLELASDPSVTVDVTPAQPFPDGSSVVWATFTKAGWGSQSIKWHLTAEADGFKIVDILSAGASLVQMERDTFQAVMRNGGLKELMAKLDARTKQLATAAE